MSWVLRRRSLVSTERGSAPPFGLDFLISLAPHQANLASRDKVAMRLALAHHFLAIGIEGIIDNPLSGILGVIILETKMAEALGDGL